MDHRLIHLLSCRHIVIELHATQNLGLYQRDWRMQKSALSLIQPFPRVITEKVLSSFSWKNMTKLWKHIRRGWSMILATRNCLMVWRGMVFNLTAFVVFDIDYGIKPFFNCQIKIICRCVEQINKASRGDLTPDELKERQVWLFSLFFRLILWNQFGIVVFT